MKTMRKKLSEGAGSIIGTVDANGHLTYGIRNVADGGNWFVVQLNSVSVTDKPVSSSGISTAVISTDNAPTGKQLIRNKLVLYNHGCAYNAIGQRITNP